MKIRDKIEVDLSDILGLISSAEDYGMSGILPDCANWLKTKLTDEEIHSYASKISSLEGYGEDDYDAIAETLEEFNNYYFGYEEI